MEFRGFLISMFVSTTIAWFAWIFILLNVNPLEAGAFAFSMFYITLATGLIGLLSLIGIFYRVVIRGRGTVLSREVRISFRHALLLTALAVCSLALSQKGVLYWWVLLVLITVVSGIEYVSLLIQHSRRD